MLAFNKKEKIINAQLSIEEYFKELSNKKNISSIDVLNAISELSKAHTQLKKQEENAEKQRKIAEKKRQEQREKERIEKVTSMDLPLDYENIFGDDARAKNVNVESLSDALVASLNVLGKVDIEFISTPNNAATSSALPIETPDSYPCSKILI